MDAHRSRPRAANRARPPLTPRTSLRDFRNFYWYLDELVEFCRQHGLPTTGQKREIVARIESFLKTGKVAAAPKPRKPTKRRGPITMRTRVTEAFKSDAETREFFKTAIGPHFHFTAVLQQFRRDKQRDGVPITYGDLVREWLAERERRKDKNYKSPLQRSWEYNRFVRDFLADKTRNKGKGIAGAARAWNAIRIHNGPRSYFEYVRIHAGHDAASGKPARQPKSPRRRAQ
jgi:SAP domain-containing new25/Domain of unknown function (DUF6434)